MTPPPSIATVPDAVEDLPRLKLREILSTYGRGLCRQPHRCEALLRDLCAGHPREIFLLTSALRERIDRDYDASRDSLPEDVLIARLSQRLADALGLAPAAARWAVETWVEALRDAPLLSPSSDPTPSTDLYLGAYLLPPSTSDSSADRRPPLGPWAWTGLCLLVAAGSCLPIYAAARVSLYRDWGGLASWLIETAWLAAGLSLGATALLLPARIFQRHAAPRHRLWNPATAPLGLLAEVLAVLLPPLTLLGVPAIWAVDWMIVQRVIAPPQLLAFDLGRILQSALVLLFVHFWLPAMLSIQAKLTSTLVPHR